MAPRPNVAETVQLGVETTPGTAVAASVRLGSLSVELDYDIKGGTQKPTGYKRATTAEVTEDAAVVKLSGKPAYLEAPYPLAGAVGTPTITTPTNGVKTRDWVFRSSTNNADTWKTFSAEQGNDQIRAAHAANLNFAGLELNFSRTQGLSWGGGGFAGRLYDDKLRYLAIVATGGTFTVTVAGQTTAGVAYNATAGTLQTALEALSNVAPGDVTVTGGPGGSAATPYRIAFTGAAFKDADTFVVATSGASLTGTTPTATLTRMAPSPVEYTLQPIQGKHLDLYVATTYAGLAGAGRFTQGFSGSFKIAGRYEPVYYIRSDQDSFGDTVEGDPTEESTLLVSAVDAGMDLVNYIRKTQRVFVRLLATGPLIESVTPDYYQTLRWDACLFLTGSPAKKAQGAVVGYEFKGVFAHDPTWGYAYEVFCRTNLAALGAAAL